MRFKEHFSNKDDLLFDHLCGSGMMGVVAYFMERDFLIGDFNSNRKIVFENLLDYYLNEDSYV